MPPVYLNRSFDGFIRRRSVGERAGYRSGIKEKKIKEIDYEQKPTVLMILDGYGLNSNCEHNAVCEAKTPVMDQLMSQCPYVRGNASGLAVVGLRTVRWVIRGGTSEHGAGRIVYQELTRITKSIRRRISLLSGISGAVENCKNNSALHLFGLVSDGGVHSL